MATPKTSASPRITCYGTAFLAEAPVDTIALKQGIASDVPQFSSPHLDASFLINCWRFLTGTMESAPSAHVKRIAGLSFRSPKTTVLYECSTDLCELLAALTPESAAEMATQWNSMYGKPNPKAMKANGRTQVRGSILMNLAMLAKQVNDDTKLMLRVDYRKQR